MYYKYIVVFLKVLFLIIFQASGNNSFQSLEKDSTGVEKHVDTVLAQYYKIYSADFNKALDTLNWALVKSKNNGWPKKEAYSNLYLGIVNYLTGKYDSAATHYLRALSLFEVLDDAQGKADTYNELAVFYHKNNDLEKALESLRFSEEICTEIGNATCLGTSLAHQAAFLTRRGKYKEAKPIIDRVLKIRIETKDSVGLGYVYLDLAECALNEGDIEKSLRLVEKSTNIRKKIGDKQGVVINTVIVGENYFADKQYKKAIPYFEETIKEALAIGFTDLVRYTYDMLEKSHVALGDFQEAYKNQTLANAFKDSLFTIEKTKVVEELQTKYETDKKEKEIKIQKAEIEQAKLTLERNRFFLIGLILLILLLLLLFAFIYQRMKSKQRVELQKERILAQQNQLRAVIHSQENERNRFSRDLHDTFGQLITTLSLQINSFHSLIRPNREIREQLFTSSSQLLSEMYQELKNICFDLMPQSLINGGIKPALEEFAWRINETSKLTITVNIQESTIFLTQLQEISVYRICQEWVNNVIKYSNASKISIQITLDTKEITLIIEDDGVGFSTDSLIKSKGNGWKNIQSRINLIKGNWELDTKLGRRGTSFILDFPNQQIQGIERKGLNEKTKENDEVSV